MAVLQSRRRKWPARSREREKMLSSTDWWAIAARKRVCTSALGGMATTVWGTQASPPSCSHSPALTGTGERVRRSDQVSADRDDHSSRHTCTGDGSCSGVMSRKKTALLRRGVGDSHHHRCSALDDERKKKRSTAGRANKTIGTRNRFTRKHRLLRHGAR